LLFGRRELVEGNGFVARVVVSGRALLVDENGECWIEGVNPGGFAASGKSPSEALAAFGSAFRAILFDIASGAEASRTSTMRCKGSSRRRTRLRCMTGRRL
jgi:hypothetical protein